MRPHPHRQDALRRCLDRGRPVREVASQLNLPESTLRGWLRQERLEREVRRLREQLERFTPDRSGRPLIRTIHHLACTGGTVISKCLAAMPHVALLSELNPLNRYGCGFEPTNPLLLLERSHRQLTVGEIRTDFLGQIAQVVDICQSDGMDLVIRDHSHTDFCREKAPSQITPIRDFLSDGYELRSVVTVRHPLDSYLGLVAQGWQSHFSPSTLDEYCHRYLAFLDDYQEETLFRYEDFCQEPDLIMQGLCKALKLEYSPDYRSRFGAITLTGDSGRTSTDGISPRPRRPVPDDVAQEVRTSAAYDSLRRRLDYEP